MSGEIVSASLRFQPGATLTPKFISIIAWSENWMKRIARLRVILEKLKLASHRYLDVAQFIDDARRRLCGSFEPVIGQFEQNLQELLQHRQREENSCANYIGQRLLDAERLVGKSRRCFLKRWQIIVKCCFSK